MNKFEDEEFDFAEHERMQQKHRKRLAIGRVIVSVVVLAGMLLFWR